MILGRHFAFIFFCVLLCCACTASAQNCANLPTQFTGNEFPSGDFFTNFQNPCYTIPLAPQGGSKTDLNDTYWFIYYKVDPRYQLIVVGSFPNARFFSLSANDDHYQLSQAILDTNMAPLTSQYVNPYQPFTPYTEGQQYGVAMNFGGTPGVQETGCMMNGYNVAVNSLDATLRHPDINWNTDPGFWLANLTATLHVVDTPQHTNPNTAGYLMVRAYMDINPADPSTIPSVIVRDVASGCAYPAAYAQQTLQIVSTSAGTDWLDHNQYLDHQIYDINYLPELCYGTDPRNAFTWTRSSELVKFPNSYSYYLNAQVPSGLPATLAAAGQVMRMRLRVPTHPPTPCTNGCSRSGNEQMRYMGLSFYPPSSDALASLADSYFTTDANGYATLIVGTGASIPAWITPANGYTYLNLAAIKEYNTLSYIEKRDILSSPNFACGAQVVPYKTSVYTPDGNMIGDYLPVVDYPLAATLPQTASELIGPGVCGVLPAGVPGVSPNCGVFPPNTTTITSIPAPAPGENPVSVQPFPPITVSGEGFGFLPQGVPFSGNSDYLEVTDLTQGWTAGMTGSLCNLSIGYWEDDRIEVVANVNQNGICPMAAGDQLAVSVWNPQTGSGPVTSTVTVSADVTYALGTSSVVVGSAAGSGSVQLITAGPWLTSSSATWLHLSTSSLSGVGATLIEFTYDPNTSSGVRTGTLNIAGLTFTVTQAGNTYTPIAPLAPLVSGLNGPQGVAIDRLGNVYIADTGNRAIDEWNPNSGQLTTLISSGLASPTGVAVDAYGNIYIADAGNHAIARWNAANPQLTPLVTGLVSPYGVVVDSQGNVYFSDSGANSISEWNASTASISTLVSAPPLSDPLGLAVDSIGNVYFAAAGNNAIVEWNLATQKGTVLVNSGLSGPTGVAVDGQGNVDFSDTGNNAIKQLNAATQQVTTWASSGLNSPAGVALDPQGNLYVADRNNNAIEKVTFGYLVLSSTNFDEIAQAGSDSVTAQVLPAGAPITATSDQSWLTISGISGGVVAFAFQANTTGVSRVAHVMVLGQPVTVTQAGDTLGSVTKSAGDGQSTITGQLFSVPLQVTVADINGKPLPGLAVTFTPVAGSSGASGTFSLIPPMPVLTDQNGNAVAPALTANNIGGPFTVTATVDSFSVTFNLTNLPYSLGASSANVGNLAGSSSVLLLAGGAWTAASNASWLTLSTANQSGTGNAVIDYGYTANSSPTPQTGTITIAGLTFTVTQAPASYAPVYPSVALVTGLEAPKELAVDGKGNIYFADSAKNAVYEWNVSTQQLTALVSSGLNNPTAVAVDSLGNVYIADTGDNAIKEWNIGTQQVTALVWTGLSNPGGIAVDAHGNVYFSDSGHNVVDEWFAATGAVTTIIPSTLKTPIGVAVDVQGNVYVADSGDGAVKEWNATTQQVSVPVNAGLVDPFAVAVDGEGNIYVTDLSKNTAKQWNPATRQAIVLASGLSSPSGVTVDGAGNVYISNTGRQVIDKLTPAYLLLGATSFTEGQPAGSDSVTAQVFPASTALTVSSTQTWLTVGSTGNGTVDFSFTANDTDNSRKATLIVCGSKVTVTQNADTPARMTKTAGSGQTVSKGQIFPTALEVTVKDAAGQPVAGVAVTFTVVPGSSGAGGTFKSSSPVVTNSSGVARAYPLTANNIIGKFTVLAAGAGLSVTFTETIAK